jgi:hypothetical protein
MNTVARTNETNGILTKKRKKTKTKKKKKTTTNTSFLKPGTMTNTHVLILGIKR